MAKDFRNKIPFVCPKAKRPVISRSEAWSLMCYFSAALEEERNKVDLTIQEYEDHFYLMCRLLGKLKWLHKHGWPIRVKTEKERL